jgi:hypothetical protein
MSVCVCETVCVCLCERCVCVWVAWGIQSGDVSSSIGLNLSLYLESRATPDISASRIYSTTDPANPQGSADHQRETLFQYVTVQEQGQTFILTVEPNRPMSVHYRVVKSNKLILKGSCKSVSRVTQLRAVVRQLPTSSVLTAAIGQCSVFPAGSACTSSQQYMHATRAVPSGTRDVPGSSLGPETDYPDWGLSWFSSVPPGKHRDSKQATTSSFHTLSNSSFTFGASQNY